MTAIADMMTNYNLLYKKPLKLRHELKYTINHGEMVLLRERLSRLFEHDKYADSHGFYRVSSLYFDTPYDKALREKVEGIRNREKFRLRYYNDNKEFIRLEKKTKLDGLCGKRSAKISLAEVQKILDGDINFLLESNEPLFIEFYSKIKGQLLRPKTLVVYEREAFTYHPGNVRITLDRNLSTSMNPCDFINSFDNKIDMSDGITVLEVKYDEFLPDIVKMALRGFAGSGTAYSKYAMSRRYE